MHRSRTTTVSLGLVILLINVALVVGLVLFFGDSSDEPGTTAGSSHGVTGTSAPGPSSTTPVGLSDVSQLVDRESDITLAVLGDGTGDEKGEWVTALGELLGQDRRVKVNNLDPSDPTRYARALSFGMAGRGATIWNGSRRGATADYAADRLSFLIPEEPDVILLSYGRDDKVTNIGGALTATFRAVRAAHAKVPVVLVLQPPNTDDTIAPVREAAAEWAKANELSTIDVASAFRAAGNPNSFVSVVDPPSVNAAGGQLWGETVFRALGGQLPGETPRTSGSATTTALSLPGQYPAGGGGVPRAITPQPAATTISTEPPPATTAPGPMPQVTGTGTVTTPPLGTDPIPPSPPVETTTAGPDPTAPPG